MSATVKPTETGSWNVSCAPCAWAPGDETPDRAAAQRRADVHNTEIHNRFPWPEASDVARWVDEQSAAA